MHDFEFFFGGLNEKLVLHYFSGVFRRLRLVLFRLKSSFFGLGVQAESWVFCQFVVGIYFCHVRHFKEVQLFGKVAHVVYVVNFLHIFTLFEAQHVAGWSIRSFLFILVIGMHHLGRMSIREQAAVCNWLRSELLIVVVHEIILFEFAHVLLGLLLFLLWLIWPIILTRFKNILRLNCHLITLTSFSKAFSSHYLLELTLYDFVIFRPFSISFSECVLMG